MRFNSVPGRTFLRVARQNTGPARLAVAIHHQLGRRALHFEANRVAVAPVVPREGVMCQDPRVQENSKVRKQMRGGW